jgi:hypothetical protein
LRIESLKIEREEKVIKIEKEFVAVVDNVVNLKSSDGKNVFFIDPIYSVVHELTERQACCIESAGNFLFNC